MQDGQSIISTPIFVNLVDTIASYTYKTVKSDFFPVYLSSDRLPGGGQLPGAGESVLASGRSVFIRTPGSGAGHWISSPAGYCWKICPVSSSLTYTSKNTIVSLKFNTFYFSKFSDWKQNR